MVFVAERRPNNLVSQKMARVICVVKKSFLKRRRKKIKKDNQDNFVCRAPEKASFMLSGAHVSI